ncbi:MAG: UvrD-helicase domain-containing protein [bacterium]
MALVERAARCLEHDAIVVANAGAGKTYLLVERYFALLESGLEPRDIVAFTFTEKAAKELKERIVARLPKHPGFRDLPEDLLAAWRAKLNAAAIGTIHQYCLKILEAARSAGQRGALKIVDEALEQALQEGALRAYLRRRFEARDPDALLLLEHYGIADLGRILERFLAIQPLEAEGEIPLPPPEALEQTLLEAVARLGRPLWEEIQAKKAARHWMSFADLERRAWALLQAPPEGLRAFLRPLSHLLVDEFQDTAPIQIRLIEALRAWAAREGRPLRVFCVGDPKQSIYRFRDVDRNLLHKTEEEILRQGGEKFDFTLNWRSTPTILELVNAFAREAFPGARDSQAQRGACPGTLARIVQGTEGEAELASEDWAKREASQVADAIQARSGELPLDRIAVLYRASGSALALLHELQARGIPYSVRGGQNLFERQEILDLHRLVYFLADPQDDLSLLGVLRSPLFLLSDASLFFLGQDKGEPSWWEHLQRPESLAGLRQAHPEEYEKAAWALSRLRRLLALGGSLSTHRLIETALRREDWGGLYAQAYREPQRLLAIEQWLDWLRTLEEDDAPLKLQETARILREVSALLPNKTPLGDLVASQGSVQLLTIHAAKGLQFDTVFLIGMNRQTRGDYPLLQRVGNALALKLPEPGKKNRRSERFEAIEAHHAEEEREEAKRLLYVAMTRAENQLWIWLQPKAARAGSLQDLLLRSLGDAAGTWSSPPPPAFPEAPGTTPPEARGMEFVAAEPAPLPPIQKETSVSELETFSLCPLRHHFAYRLRLPSSPIDLTAGLGATETGTLLHRALHLLQLRPGADPEAILRELLAETGNEAAPLLSALLDPLDSYLNSQAYAAIRGAREDYSELPFLLKLRAAGLRGQIDRLLKGDRGWTLIDFKYAGRGHSARELLESYGFQLKTYALASRILLREPLQSVQVHVLNRAEAHSFQFGEEELDGHREALETLAEQLVSGPPKLEAVRWRPACANCPYNVNIAACPVPKGRPFQVSL